jgi:hypothetical protein
VPNFSSNIFKNSKLIYFIMSFYRRGNSGNDGDETDGSINRRMRGLGKSGPDTDDEETRNRYGDVSSPSESEEDHQRGEKKKPRGSKSRGRANKRSREQGTPTGVTPKSKEMKVDLPEPRFRARFDKDGVLIKASSEREEANRLARLDKERRFIAEARPHRPNGGQRGGGGDIDWQKQRSRNNRPEGRGRSEGRPNDGYGKKSNFNNRMHPGATQGSNAARNSFFGATQTSGAAQAENRPTARKSTEQGASAPTASEIPDNNLENQLTNSFTAPKPSSSKSLNPSFAAMLAERNARAEEVVYVFSGTDEQLPLQRTHWNMILIDIQEQALTFQIKGEKAPEYKSSNFSQDNDKGFLGVASAEMAELIVQAVARITIEGVKFRGWRAHELQTKHLVTIEIKPELASCAMTRIIQGMMMKNSLRGEVLSAWIIPGDLPSFKVLKYFADDELHACLLERRNGDQGWNIFLHVGAQFNKAHISQQPGAQAAALAEAAELRVEQEKKKVIERAKAMADWEAGKAERAAKAKAKSDAAKTDAAKTDDQKREEADAAKLKDDEDAALLQGDMDTDACKK